MKHLDWDQDAGLSRSVFGDGWALPMGEDVAQGTLHDMVSRYLEFPEAERSMMTITIDGGFHMDGVEIEYLAKRRQRERPPCA